VFAPPVTCIIGPGIPGKNYQEKKKDPSSPGWEVKEKEHMAQ
jgi:hypothetical protein